MKKVALLSLVTLLTCCAQAMETGGPLEVAFKFFTPKIPTLHNKITTVQVKDGATLKEAIKELGKINNLTLGATLSMLVVFDDINILSNQWQNIAIQGVNSQVMLGNISPRNINMYNPIRVGFPGNIVNPYRKSDK